MNDNGRSSETLPDASASLSARTIGPAGRRLRAIVDDMSTWARTSPFAVANAVIETWADNIEQVLLEVLCDRCLEGERPHKDASTQPNVSISEEKMGEKNTRISRKKVDAHVDRAIEVCDAAEESAGEKNALVVTITAARLQAGSELQFRRALNESVDIVPWNEASAIRADALDEDEEEEEQDDREHEGADDDTPRASTKGGE